MLGNEEGQGLVEYALILVLAAVVVIAILSLLGPIIEEVPVAPPGDIIARDDLYQRSAARPTRLYVLSNDSYYSSPGYSDPLSAPDMTNEGGTLEIREDRSDIIPTQYLYYEPGPGFVGHDTFTYRLGSGPDHSDDAQVMIAVGDVPLARADKACAIANSPLTIIPLDNDTGGASPLDPTTINLNPTPLTQWYVDEGRIQYDIGLDGALTYTFDGVISRYEWEETVFGEFTYTVMNSDGDSSNPGRISIETKDASQVCEETAEAVMLLDMESIDQTTENTPDGNDLTEEAAERLAIFVDQVSEQDALFADTFSLGQSALDAFVDAFLANAKSSGEDSLVQEIKTLQQEMEAGNFDYLFTALPELANDINVLRQM